MKNKKITLERFAIALLTLFLGIHHADKFTSPELESIDMLGELAPMPIPGEQVAVRVRYNQELPECHTANGPFEAFIMASDGTLWETNNSETFAFSGGDSLFVIMRLSRPSSLDQDEGSLTWWGSPDVEIPRFENVEIRSSRSQGS